LPTEPTWRPSTEKKLPDPLASVCGLKTTRTSALVVETDPSETVGPEPAPGNVIVPTPDPTLKLALLPVTVQAPPWSALPQPLVVVRPKSSEATSVGAGLVTVTVCCTEPVPPALSVTVSVIVCGPAAP